MLRLSVRVTLRSNLPQSKGGEMATLVTTDASHLQFGDRVILNSKTWTIKGIMGPDNIGTYDLFLLDEEYTAGTAIVNGRVTISV